MAISQRSRNRLREHGDHWFVEDARKSITAFDLNGSPAVLMACDSTAPCGGWAGWIPLDEAKALGIVPECFEPKS